MTDAPGDGIKRDPSRLAIFTDYVHNIARWLAVDTAQSLGERGNVEKLDRLVPGRLDEWMRVVR